MHVVKVRNVNEAIPIGIKLLHEHGVAHPSRNGQMIEVPDPVTTVYLHPWERVSFCPVRDANPFFHFFESLWMLEGRNDTEFVCHFAKNMVDFSDDGKTLNGAYGFRWRQWFGHDQLAKCVQLLRANPMDRRVVLQHWDGTLDLGADSKDVPCNTSVMFKLRSGFLDMTVTNRSNDAIWGAYGANAVHFSVLHEYVASMVGASVGKYFQVSNSFHAYTWNDKLDKLKDAPEPVVKYADLVPFDPAPGIPHRYFGAGIRPYPMFDNDVDPDLWDIDLTTFFSLMPSPWLGTYRHSFFKNVAVPLYSAWGRYKDRDFWSAAGELSTCRAHDWAIAGVGWLNRREEALARKGRG